METFIDKLLSGVPDYTSFLTLEEIQRKCEKLSRKYPDLAQWKVLGKSGRGRPIHCLKIGKGSRNALMFGCPHPNEPIGTMTLDYFTEALLEDDELRQKLDYTWYIVNVWDVDGFELNREWLKGPYSIDRYARWFYRPPGYQQVDWNFPIRYKKLQWEKSIPETEVMMALLDEIKPHFIYALHNAGFGGAYWYLSEGLPALYPKLYAAAEKEGIPLHLGASESADGEQFAPAVFHHIDIRKEYDHLERGGVAEPQQVLNVGTSSAQYAKEKYGSFTLLTELPYFFDKRIGDNGAGTMTKASALQQQRAWNREANRFLQNTLNRSREYMAADNPFYCAVSEFIREDGDSALDSMLESEEYKRLCTKAEEFDLLYGFKFYKLLIYGMLVRANEYELDLPDGPNDTHSGERKAVFRQAAEEAERARKDLADFLEENLAYQVIPIKSLVKIQLESGLRTIMELG